MSDDVITMIQTDHRELQRLFAMMKKDKSSRPLALPLAVAMLTAHSRAEEDYVYPALAKEAGEKEEAQHGAEEHHEAEKLAHTLLAKDPESSDFEHDFSEWVAAVEHHIEEEENDLLPALGRALGTGRLAELGQEFAARRAQELTGAAGNGHGGPGKTKAELYEQAREAGIEGRSSMDKEELAREVSRSQGG